MRLINVHTLQLEEFFARPIPEYVILSHRWGLDEVSYKDYLKGRFQITQNGYKKILSCCEVARKLDWKYVWIDTCCIDKRSSAELSEAINSMYSWYQNAQMCLVYLADVPSKEDGSWETQFRESKWFTRGWTLQELLASRTTTFHAENWSVLGCKLVAEELTAKTWQLVNPLYVLNGLIEQITDIPYDALSAARAISMYSVAQIMSWAAGRETTRVEDRAYSLLGLFDVNMPLLYGEGHKAFRRLQHEIIRQSNDETVFAFAPILDQDDQINFARLRDSEKAPIRLPDRVALHEYNATPHALLATSPDQFVASGDIVRAQLVRRYPYQLTNQGLEVHLRAEDKAYTLESERGYGRVILYRLNCREVREHAYHALPRYYWLMLERRRCGHHIITDSYNAPDNQESDDPRNVLDPTAKFNDKWRALESEVTIWIHTSDALDPDGNPICG